MQSNKSFIITISLIALIIIALIIFYFARDNRGPSLTLSNNTNSTNSHVENNQTDQNNNTITNNTITNNTNITINNRQSLSMVNDYQEFFNINALINNYYSEMTLKNVSTILNLMDSSYKVNNKVNENNINSFIETKYEDITFISKTIYAKGQNGIMYYFVTGEEQLYSYGEEELIEKENVNYLVIVDTNNITYSITPLTVSSLFDYAQNYKMLSSKKIELNDSNKYISSKYSDQTISVYYLNYYRIILYLNTKKAYDMLSTEYKSLFADYEDFVNHIEEIYEILNPNIFSYAATGENGKRNYSIVLNNERKVNFVETSIMNFTVNIK